MTPDLVSKAASMFGESENGISKAASGMVPTILGGLLNKTGDSSAFSGIFNSLKESGNAGYLDNLGGMLGDNSPAKDASSSFVSNLFGDKSEGAFDFLSKNAGIGGGAVKGILGMVAPMVMGYVGKMIKDKSMNAAGLSGFLNDQKSNIMSAMPEEGASFLGFNPSAAVSSAASSVKGAATGAAGAVTGAASGAVGAVANAAPSKPPFRRLLAPALLFLGILAAWQFFNKRKGASTVADLGKTVASKTVAAGEAIADKTKDVGGAVADTAAAAGGAVADTAAAAGGAVADTAAAAGDAVADLLSWELPGGQTISGTGNGVEKSMVEFLQDDSAELSKTTWYNFDRITFQSGSSKIDMEKSEEQLTNVQSIMKAYPNSKIKIGGYTDNTGSEKANMNISQKRADAMKAAIVAGDIDGSRIETEGYGPAHPVCPANDTAECKKQNRRIAVRFDAK